MFSIEMSEDNLFMSIIHLTSLTVEDIASGVDRFGLLFRANQTKVCSKKIEFS